MKRLLLCQSLAFFAFSAKATEASIAMVGDGGSCPPSTIVTVQLVLHGIDTCTATVNGTSIGTITYPYQITFTTLSVGNVNDIVVTTGDFLRRTATVTFHLSSIQTTFNKRLKH